MTGPQANCPSCGAPVEFRWAGAVQTTCTTCNSILLRHDLDLEKVGQVSQPPPKTSRIQLGTEGRYDGKSFMVVGRIAYSWERGGWSEWHLVYSDGSTAWLSDAQDEYAITQIGAAEREPPPQEKMKPGIKMVLDGRHFEVVTITEARYAGVEGELPFEYWDHELVSFVDLKSHDGGLATIDYSDEHPTLFVGEYVNFGGLGLTGLLDPEVQQAEEVKTLSCPNCGGSVSLLRPTETVNVGCQYCGSILDAASPGLDILQKIENANIPKTKVPLGSIGRFRGADYQVLGFQFRTIHVEGIMYGWSEYLMHNHEHGFRYLSEYDGHWNYITPLKSLPEVKNSLGGKDVATLHGEPFKLFQTASARTSSVVGEFPWEVRVGDQAIATDYVSPPRMLSSEKTEDETSWSLGEYTEPSRIWEAFGLEGNPSRPSGVFANQPGVDPAATKRTRKTFLGATAVLIAAYAIRSAFFGATVAEQGLQYDAGQPDSSIFVVGPFELEGRPSNVQIKTRSDVDNNWLYLDMDLLNVDTGERRSIGREVSYYHGRDGGESWSEGSRSDGALLSSVPAGTYALRIFPSGPANVFYTVSVRRDVPPTLMYLMVFFLLLVPAVVSETKHYKFEIARWAESDFPMVTSDD
jgi:hypothetical protein